MRDGCSGLRAMGPEALTAGMERLEADLRTARGTSAMLTCGVSPSATWATGWWSASWKRRLALAPSDELTVYDMANPLLEPPGAHSSTDMITADRSDPSGRR